MPEMKGRCAACFYLETCILYDLFVTLCTHTPRAAGRERAGVPHVILMWNFPLLSLTFTCITRTPSYLESTTCLYSRLVNLWCGKGSQGLIRPKFWYKIYCSLRKSLAFRVCVCSEERYSYIRVGEAWGGRVGREMISYGVLTPTVLHSFFEGKFKSSLTLVFLF